MLLIFNMVWLWFFLWDSFCLSAAYCPLSCILHVTLANLGKVGFVRIKLLVRIWLKIKLSFRSFYVLIYCLKAKVSIVRKTMVRNHRRAASSPSAKFKYLRPSTSAFSEWLVNQPITSLLATLCWRDPTAVHSCNSWPSVWNLSILSLCC